MRGWFLLCGRIERLKATVLGHNMFAVTASQGRLLRYTHLFLVSLAAKA